MFDRILVAVDNSPQAMAALTLAGELATQLKSELALVHVMVWPRAVVPEALIFDERLAQERRQEVDDLIARATAMLPAGVEPAECFVPSGLAAEQIVETARSWAADVLVMGTHGRGRLATLVLGSTAAEVLRTAPCPVLLVRNRQVRPATSYDIKPERRESEAPLGYDA